MDKSIFRCVWSIAVVTIFIQGCSSGELTDSTKRSETNHDDFNVVGKNIYAPTVKVAFALPGVKEDAKSALVIEVDARSRKSCKETELATVTAGYKGAPLISCVSAPQPNIVRYVEAQKTNISVAPICSAISSRGQPPTVMPKPILQPIQTLIKLNPTTTTTTQTQPSYQQPPSQSTTPSKSFSLAAQSSAKSGNPSCTKVCSGEAGHRLTQTLRNVQMYMLQKGATQSYCASLAARLAVTDISIVGEILNDVDFGNGTSGKCGDCYETFNGKSIECMTIGGMKAWNYDVNYALHGMLAKICSDGTLREWTGYGMQLPLATMAWIWKSSNQKGIEYTPQLEYWLNYGINFNAGLTPESYSENRAYPLDDRFGTCRSCPVKDPRKNGWPAQLGLGTTIP